MRKKNKRQIQQVPATMHGDGKVQSADQTLTTRGSPARGPKAAVSNGVAPQKQSFTEKEIETATTKYRVLYEYSTDVLLKEHERFNRADDKAAKYSTVFVFLIGIFAYFEKWSFDRVVKQPDSYMDIPVEWPVMVVGAIGLCLSGIGWFSANRVIMLRPYASRPLNKETSEFYDNNTLLNIYDSCARRNITAYEENTRTTMKKYAILTFTHKAMRLGLLCLADLIVLYALYSLF